MINKIKILEYIEEIQKIEEIHIMKEHCHHGDFSTYDHCKQVVNYSIYFAEKLKLNLDYKSLVRGAFLHDFFLYDWHKKNDNHDLHAFSHPKRAAENAKKYFDLNKKEINIIESHMWPLTISKIPKSREAFLVCCVDTFCAIIETIKIRKKFIVKDFEKEFEY